MDLLCFCSVLCLLCLCARLFTCALWSPAVKVLTSWLSFVVSTVSLSLSHWYPGSGVWKGFSDETPCVHFSFCFLRLQFYFVNYVIVSCELPYYNSFGQRMVLKN